MRAQGPVPILPAALRSASLRFASLHSAGKVTYLWTQL